MWTIDRRLRLRIKTDKLQQRGHVFAPQQFWITLHRVTCFFISLLQSFFNHDSACLLSWLSRDDSVLHFTTKFRASKRKKIKEFFCFFCDCLQKVKSSKLYCHVTFGIVWLTLKKCNIYLTYSIKATTDDQFQYLMIYLFVCVHLLIQTWIAAAAVSAGRPTAFPSQPRDIISPACPVSSSGSSLWQTCPKRLPREALRWWSSLSWVSTVWRSSSST